MHADIYRKDLENRFPSYTFRATKVGDLNRFEALDGLVLICCSTNIELADAIFIVRQGLVGGHEVMPMLTTVQISEISNIEHGTLIYDLTTDEIKVPTVSGMASMATKKSSSIRTFFTRSKKSTS